MALVTEQALAVFRADASSLVAESGKVGTAYDRMRMQADNLRASTGQLVNRKEHLQKTLRPMGERMEKVRSAMALSGVAASQSAGQFAAWAQVGTQILAFASPLAIALAGIGIAAGKLVEHFKNAEEAARAFHASALLFGVTRQQVDTLKESVEDLTEAQAIAAARVAQQFQLTQEQMVQAINAAKGEVQSGAATFEQAFAKAAQTLGSERGLAQRFGDVGEQVEVAREKVEQLEKQLARTQALRDASQGTVTYSESLATTSAELERAREQLALLEGQFALVAEARRKEATAEAERAQGGASRPAGATALGPVTPLPGLAGPGIEDTLRIDMEVEAERRKQELINGIIEEADRERERRAQSLASVKNSLVTSEVERLRMAEQEKLAVIQDALEADLLSQEEAARARAQIAEQTAVELNRIERARAASGDAIRKQEVARQVNNFRTIAGASLGVAQDVIGFVAMAEEQKTKETLKSIGTAAVWRSAFYAIEAIASFATGNFVSGAVLSAQAAAMGGLATAAFAQAGSAPSAPSISGGGGGGSAGPAFGGGGSSFGGGGSGFGGPRGGGEAPVTIIINGPAFATRAEVGQEVERALAEHRRLRGG